MSRVNPAPSDGRAFTQYVSAGQYHAQLQAKYRVSDNNAMRAFLQANAAAVKQDGRRLNAFQSAR